MKWEDLIICILHIKIENIKNNREFTSLTKEVEFQTLEIELAEKQIKEADYKLDNQNDIIKVIKADRKDKNTELKLKKDELDSIVKETEKDEKSLYHLRLWSHGSSNC